MAEAPGSGRDQKLVFVFLGVTHGPLGHQVAKIDTSEVLQYLPGQLVQLRDVAAGLR